MLRSHLLLATNPRFPAIVHRLGARRRRAAFGRSPLGEDVTFCNQNHASRKVKNGHGTPRTIAKRVREMVLESTGEGVRVPSVHSAKRKCATRTLARVIPSRYFDHSTCGRSALRGHFPELREVGQCFAPLILSVDDLRATRATRTQVACGDAESCQHVKID